MHFSGLHCGHMPYFLLLGHLILNSGVRELWHSSVICRSVSASASAVSEYQPACFLKKKKNNKKKADKKNLHKEDNFETYLNLHIE